MGRFWAFVCLSICALAVLTAADPVSFSRSVYPAMEGAGCRGCHNYEGVASGTRLHFPEIGSAEAHIEAFGRSLVVLVDRENPELAIAHREERVIAMYAQAGLRIDGPIRHGGWWHGIAHQQDVIAAIRA